MKFNFGPFNQFRTQTTADLKGSGRGPVAEAIQKRWTFRYLDYLRKRYRDNSSGEGDWPPNAPSTLKKDVALGRRRRGIMRVTDTLYDALIPGNPGNVITPIPSGVRVGIGGEHRHPSGKLTIAAISRIMQNGSERIPARAIVVPPDTEVIEGMQKDIKLAFRDVERGFPLGHGSEERRFTRGL